MKDLSCSLSLVTQVSSQRLAYLPTHLPLLILGTTLGSSLLSATPAWSQSTVLAADDGTGTIVTQQDEQVKITAGSLSTNGENLFHSFETFSVEVGDRATFITDPTVQNILTRVNGDKISNINGTLEIAGSQANLFFMNPAGILVGPEAALNLPANLTLTTAEAIGFEQGNFSAIAPSNYTTLNSSPTGELFFNTQQPGTILNQGSLSVSENATLNLVGHTVINQGNLSAPSGNITVAAVPQESTLRLNQNNSLLTLELTTNTQNTNSIPTPTSSSAISPTITPSVSPTITPTDLPALLTHSEQIHANSLSVNPDGSVSLAVSTTASTTASSVAPSILISGTLTTSNTTTPVATGGDITLLGEQIVLTNATLAADGTAGGGNIHIGGNTRGQGPLPTAQNTYINESSNLSANALLSGNGGQVTIWANDTTQYLGNIAATGGQFSGNGGFVEVSGKESVAFSGTVDTSAPQGEVGSLLIDPSNIFIVDSSSTVLHDNQLDDYSILGNDSPDIMFISADFLESLSENSDIVLEATNDISIIDLTDNELNFSAAAGDITFTADADNDGTGSIVVQDPADTLIAPGRSVNLSGRFIYLGDLITASPQKGGDITINAGASLFAGNIDASATTGQNGNLSITANDNISARSIRAANDSESGMFSATSQSGNITIEELDVLFTNNVNISTPGDISINGLDLPNFVETLLPPPEPNNIPNGLITQVATLSASSSESNNIGSDIKSAHANQQTSLTSAEANAAIAALDSENNQLFSNYFGRELATQEMSLEDIQSLLANIEKANNNRSAIVYVTAPTANKTDLELLFFTANDAPIQTSVTDINPDTLSTTVNHFRADLATSSRRGGDYYLEGAQQLHQWLIDPIQSNLDTAAIDTLIFVMDEGLRTLPIAALHDGSSYLAESYSLGIVPSLSMLNTQYAPLITAEETAEVLAMGISNFDWHRQFETLPHVPQEIETIVETWPATGLLNEQFTKKALIEQREHIPYSVIHFATHAKFQAGTAEDSYIQLWDEKLLLSELGNLDWHNPAVELLVLSACNTAIDSPEAEMGFAGLAIASGVNSAMASLWSVSDAGTLTLMEAFYEQLQTTPTKAEALQKAQLSLLESEFSHPYYWSGFTMIGSPW